MNAGGTETDGMRRAEHPDGLFPVETGSLSGLRGESGLLCSVSS